MTQTVVYITNNCHPECSALFFLLCFGQKVSKDNLHRLKSMLQNIVILSVLHQICLPYSMLLSNLVQNVSKEKAI